MLVAILFTTVLIGVFLLFLLFIGTFIYGAFFAFKLAKFKKNVAKIDSKLVETIKIPIFLDFTYQCQLYCYLITFAFVNKSKRKELLNITFNSKHIIKTNKNLKNELQSLEKSFNICCYLFATCLYSFIITFLLVLLVVNSL